MTPPNTENPGITPEAKGHPIGEPSGGWPPATVRGIAFALFLGAFLLYLPSLSLPYLCYDDDIYVTGNPVVKAGLTAKGIAWAFSSFQGSNWHPVTWLSHMTDVSLFGLSPAGPHAVNVLLHGGTAVLLFLTLLAMTGAPGRSLFVAALFAVHPLQVENVSWVAERKSLLSAFFFVSALWAYARYAKRPSGDRYAVVALLFILSLLAKPMAVTFPFVLLLLDVWPLGRLGGAFPGTPEPLSPGWQRIVAEKSPLILLSILSSVATVAAQRSGGALIGLEGLPLADRFGNAAISLLAYVGKAAWPEPLAAFYPFPRPLRWEIAIPCALGLAALSATAITFRRKAPWFFTGWFWFAGMLFPVIGIVQVGSQAMADRYAYLPIVGFFVVVAWGGERLLAHSGLGGGAIPVFLAASAAAACVFVALPQQQLWRGDETLFSHAAETVPNNWFAEMNLGVALNRRGRPAEAEGRLRKALEYNPAYRDARYNLAVVLAQQGRMEEAEEAYRKVLERWPHHPPSLNNLGLLLAERGRVEEAVSLYRRALEAQPRFSRARVNLGTALSGQGKVDEALAEFDIALRRMPSDPAAHFQAALAWKRKGGKTEAARHFREVLRMVPGNEAVRKELAEIEEVPSPSRKRTGKNGSAPSSTE